MNETQCTLRENKNLLNYQLQNCDCLCVQGEAVGGARERPTNFGEGSLASLANHRTTSDCSSLAAQSPLSPPRATSPTIEVSLLYSKSSFVLKSKIIIIFFILLYFRNKNIFFLNFEILL